MPRSTRVVLALCVAAPTLITTAPTGGVSATSGDIVFNEIMYHPEDDHPEGEFLELFNRHDAPVDLSGWCVDGIRFCFDPGTTIDARGYLVTTSAVWEGSLSNGGEELALLDADGEVVDELEYDDKGQWAANTDGEGASHQRLDPLGASDDPGNWRGDAPTPGARNRVLSDPMPVFDDVEHTVLPDAGEPIEVTGEVVGAGTANVRIDYLVGFGDVRSLLAPIVDDTFRAELPGQPAGSLVRYRVVAFSDSDVEGTFPRQGDGMAFSGTTVARPGSSELPRFEWFMPDDVYERAVADLTLRGDDGYPAVFAYDGQVFDNTKVRVKGQTSRFWPKKKWKFILPAGHELEIEGMIEDVDEFSMHSNWSDKSFLRETLAAEFMDAADLPTSQAFPVRLERNGEFYGLYTYVEQHDGSFRDRNGFGEATVYEVGGNDLFANMAPSEATEREELLRRRYDKDTNEWDDDDALRELIVALNGPPAARRAYIDAHVDVASVVNTIAASAVIQHQDYGQKNYDLALNDVGLWEIYPTDFDLTWGRRPSFSGCSTLCDDVLIGGSFEHPGTPLFAAFWFDPEFADLIRRRIRTLAEEHFVAGEINERVIELRDLVAADAVRDRAIWGTYGRQQGPGEAAAELVGRFVVPQEQRLVGSLVQQGRVSSAIEPPNAPIEITRVQYDEEGGLPPHLVVTNRADRRIDVSGYAFPELDTELRGGLFLNPGESAFVVEEEAGVPWTSFGGARFGGVLREDLDDPEHGFVLTARDGTVVDRWQYLPPGESSEFAGEPNRSAFISVVAVGAQGLGYLQVLDCEADEGGTANVTHDGPDQIRATAAVVRFDDEGRLCVYNSSATNVVVDVQGYLADPVIDDVEDDRLVDTRESGPKPVAGSLTTIVGRPDASAVVGLSAVQADGLGFLQILPCDGEPGDVANLTVDRPRQIRTGLAVVRFPSSGELCVYTSVATHVVVDLQAYLSDAGVDDVDDTRLLDTRTASIPASGSQTVISGRADTSALVSLAAVQTTGGSFLQVLPCGASPGTTANVNADGPGQNVSNLAVVRFDGDGEACVFTFAATHLVVDLQAYFEPGAFDDIVDVRALDTRP